MNLAIYGAGGMGPVFWELAHRIDMFHERWNNIVFVDDVHPGDLICGSKILSFEEAKSQFNNVELEFTISLGNPHSREKLAQKVGNAGFQLATLIEPRLTSFPRGVEIGRGAIISAQTILDVDVHIGDNVFVQGFCNIGHGTTIGNNSTISPFTMICGNCKIGKNVFFGTHSAVREKTSVGDNVVIGMFTPVRKDVPDNYTVFSQNSKMVPNDSEIDIYK